MRFHVTHPLISHPYHPELVTGEGVVRLARAAEAAGFDGYGFTDHPAPTQAWLDAGGHDALDAYLSMQSHRLNDVMKALTMISTIMLPLMFITGLYGMN